MSKSPGQLRLIWAGLACVILTIASVTPVGANFVPVAANIEGSDEPGGLRFCRGWQRVDSPTTTGYEYLSGVAAVADDDVWAVGISDPNPDTISDVRPLAMHWEGQSWQRVPTIPDADSLFNDVSASPSGAVWAVGWQFMSVSTARPLVARWNGQAWTEIAVPPLEHPFAVLNGVDAVGDDDIWAVGYYADQGEVGPITAHWDGLSWSWIPSASEPSAEYTQLNQVSGARADGVFTVGNAQGPRPFAAMWDGILVEPDRCPQ